MISNNEHIFFKSIISESVGYIKDPEVDQKFKTDVIFEIFELKEEIERMIAEYE